MVIIFTGNNNQGHGHPISHHITGGHNSDENPQTVLTRVLRNNNQIWLGKMQTLKHHKVRGV